MKAIIFQNAYYSTTSSQHQIDSIIKALADKAIEYILFNNIADFLKKRPKADFCIFLDKDYHTASILEHYGLKVYNNSSAIMCADSKISSYIKCLNVVDMPASIPSPLRYTYSPLQDTFLEYASKLGYPLVLKADKSSLGKDVHLVKSEHELIALDKQYYEKRYLLQEYVEESVGASIRAIVVGGKATHFLRYTNTADFRSNKELGGVCAPFTVNSQFVQTAEKVAKKLGLFYCGVDFFELPTPKLIEVNGNAYFAGIEGCYNINIAELFIAEILQDL